MSDQEKKQETTITQQPDAENKKKSTKPAQGELTDQELDKVAGGDESPKESVTFTYGSMIYKY